MTRKRRRLYAVVTGLALLALAAFLMLSAFEENIVFFRTPSDLTANDIPPGRQFRLGGLVEEGSVRRLEGGAVVAFRITDLQQTQAVTYRGILPDLFREGQGVVAEGALDDEGIFRASEVLAKHDETYMPPEVAEALRESGEWRGDEH